MNRIHLSPNQRRNRWQIARNMRQRVRPLRPRREVDRLETRALPSTLSINNAFVTEGNSGTTDAIFTVNLSQAATQTVTVDYFTTDETADADVDYQARSGTLTFAAGDTSKTIAIPVIGDSIDEPDETFSVNLTNAVNATVSDNQGTGTIRDDDSSTTPSLSINNALVSEGASGTTDATFTVFLSQAASLTVTVDFLTADGTASAPSDYVAQSGTLTFNAGETSKTITVRVNGDTLDESDETFLVNLTNASNATIGDGQGEGTIRDDDPGTTPSLTINNATVREGNAGTIDAVFTVSLSQASAQTVMLNFSTQDGSASAPSDYQTQSGTLNFAPGETSKTITVPVNGDTTDEFDETFVVTLTNPSNATFADAQGTGTILDDDPAPVVTVSISDATVTEGDSEVANALFNLVLSAASNETVTVQFNTADGTATAGSDYQSRSGTVTFAPGDTLETISVAVNGDTLSEPNETFVVNLTNPIHATIADSEGTGTITDNDLNPALSISDASVVEGNSGDTPTAVFTVTLSGRSGQTVTVDFSTAGGSATSPDDFSAVSGQLVFNPGDTSQTISVPVRGDTVDEPDETFFVNLKTATGASITDQQAVGTIRDDDGSPSVPTLSISDVVVTEGNSGTGNAIFTVVLSPAHDQTVTVDFATADGTATSPSDFLARSGTLTFQAGDTTETITVPINGDTATEPDETFFVNLTNASTATIGDNQASGTIRDDDSGGGSGGSPTLSINDVTTTEGNSGTVSMVFTITLSARATVPVTVDIATTDGSAQAPSDYESRSGRLTFTPGETSKTLTVPVNGDFVDEQNENFFVNLSSASNATIADGHAVGTIIDDDPTEPPPFSVSISDASVTEGDSGTATALFRVTLSTVMAQRVTVEFATSDGSALAGSDYVAQSGRVTFAPGETIEVIAVTVHGDRADEENENFFVNLNTATNATIADGQAVGVIVDDDPASAPQLSINDVTIVEGNAGTTNAVFTITLSAASAQTVTVDFATGAGSAMAPDDFDSTSGTLTFAPGERTSTIAVPVHGDTLAELNEQFFVNLSNATNATIASARGVGTISNDDGGQTPGACRVRESRGMLEIVGDNTANAIQVDDAGNGNISVSSDCGINESFSGVSRLQVLAQGGNDDVRYTLSGTPIMARWVTIDMGDGDDSSSVQASAVTISQNLQIRVQGGSGADRMAAAVDAVLARSNTPLGLFMDGGLGADTMDATVRLRGAPVKGSIRITGDNDNDTLTLNLDLPRTAQRRLRVRIDGGQGVDTCSAPALSQVRRC